MEEQEKPAAAETEEREPEPNSEPKPEPKPEPRPEPRPKPTRPEAFRDIFLSIIRPPEAKVFRQFIDQIQERSVNRSLFEDKHPQFSYTAAEVLAAMSDLAFLATFLRNVSSDRQWTLATPAEKRFADLSDRFAIRVAVLARELEREIARILADCEEGAPEVPTGRAG